MNSQILIIGIGNTFRGDDSAGILSARILKGQIPEGVTVMERRGEGLDLLDAWEGFSTVILIDAIKANAEPGTIRSFDLSKCELPKEVGCSTHTVSLADLIELGRELNQVPKILMLFGVVGEQFGVGEKMSLSVEEALPKLVSEVQNVIRRLHNA